MSRDCPINDLVKHESYLIPQPVNSLPVKRLFDYRFSRLREATKLPKEFELASCDEVLLKVKIVGVNYARDFELLKSEKHNPKFNVVPGNKIIGRVVKHQKSKFTTSSKLNSNAKYLVFPHSNCILQNVDACTNCSYLINNQAVLDKSTYHLFKAHKCLRNLEYGYNIDGGLQDYIKVKAPGETLVKIPENVSLHDCCFFMELMLPFYVFVKDNFTTDAGVAVEGRVLVILNDIQQEINDILIVLKHFNIDQKHFWFVDAHKMKTTKVKFNHAFVFDVSDECVHFACQSVISTGLESTKSRYNLVLFTEHKPDVYARHKSLEKFHPDKAVCHFRLSYKDRLYAGELLEIMSNLNTSPQDLNARPSVTSIETSASTFSSNSIHSGSTSGTAHSASSNFDKKVKNLRFREEDSIIDEIDSVKKKSSHYSWLYYDKDIGLCNDYEYSDDEDTYDVHKFHSCKQMNKMLHSSNLTRVCYSNKSNKPVKINAFIFA